MKKVHKLLSVAVAAVLSAAATSDGATEQRPGFPIAIGGDHLVFTYEAITQVVDLAGDGNRRIVTSILAAHAAGGLWLEIAIIRPGGSVERIDGAPAGSGDLLAPAFLDIDDDGRYEMVTTDRSAQEPRARVKVKRNDGSVAWEVGDASANPEYDQFYPSVFSVADLDGDGRPWLIGVDIEFRQCPSCELASRWFAWDRNGSLRNGWPVTVPSPPLPCDCSSVQFYAPPSVFDVDGDFKDEILAGDQWGDIFCLTAGGQPCAGFPVRFWSDYPAPPPYFALGSLTYIPTIFGPRIFLIDDNRREVHSMSIACQDQPGFPRGQLGDLRGRSLAVAEILGRPWAFGSGWEDQHLIDPTNGAYFPGWPVSTPIWDWGQGAIGEVGPSGSMAFFVAGFGVVDHSYNDLASRLTGFDLSGTLLPGFPTTINETGISRALSLGTLDGEETTLCWLTSSEFDGSSPLNCYDLGVPWDRGRVHWGTYAFDLQHTSRWRRLYQIDRQLTQLTLSATEMSSEAGADVEVSVLPLGADGLPLGPDQMIRFARRPVFGEFVGRVRYDPATGVYSRTYRPAIDESGRDIEFRVFVNEELHSQRPTLRLIARPHLNGAVPAELPIDRWPKSLVLGGSDLERTASVVSLDSGLVVDDWTLLDANRIRVSVHTPSGTPHWASLRVIATDGRASNTVAVFLFDPAIVTLLAKKEGQSGARLDWYGGGGGLGSWLVERSPLPTFPASNTAAVYSGGQRTTLDAATATPILFYRVRWR